LPFRGPPGNGLRASLLFLTPVLWGATFPAAKLALTKLDALTFMAWTRALGVLTILVASGFLWGLATPSASPTWAGFRAPRRVAVPGLVLGGLIFAAYVLQTVGLESTTATNAGFITGLYVVFTPLLVLILFRQPLARSVWIAVAASLVGLALLSTETVRALRPRPGDLLVLASALAWAGHVVALGRFAPRFSTPALAVAQLAAAAGLHLLAAAPGGLQVRAAWSVAPLLVVTGVLGTGVAYTLQVVAQKEISAARAAVILSGESLASAVISALWLGERLLLHQGVGAVLIVGAMVVSETTARRRLEPVPFALGPGTDGPS